MPQAVYLREPHGRPLVQLAVHIVFDDRKAIAFSKRQNPMADGWLGVGARRVVQQGLCEERARPVSAAGSLQSLYIRARRHARDGNEVDVLPAKLLEQHKVAGILDE